MTFGRPELGRSEVLEHRSTRGGRWLRERRIRLALWIAVIEGVLIVFHVIPWSIAIVIAIALIAGYFWGRDRLPGTARQVAWIGAASQAVVIFVPILLTMATILAFTVLVVIAVIALLVLLGDRR